MKPVYVSSPLKPPQRLMVGLVEIGAYVGAHPQTIRRWAAKYGFPIVKRPDGAYTTSARLIDLWLMAHLKIRQKHAAQAA